ncbi:MAG: hypothetical protein WCD66_07975, partial [Rhodanobacteraceae bacterium]
EVRGDIVLLIAFAYGQDDDKPIFYYSAGNITHSKPLDSTGFDPPIALVNESAYEYLGPLYRFNVGPCITCAVTNWDTSEHAVETGKTYLRFADENHAYVSFLMNDGSSIGSFVRRQGFGRPAFVVRYDGPILDPHPTLLMSLQGEWVLTDMDQNADKPLNRHFNFTMVEGPAKFESNVFGRGYYNQEMVRFIDPDANAMLSCLSLGCALVENDEVTAYIKFRDIGIDRFVGYVGERMYSDSEDLNYRSAHLVTGVRIADPAPMIDTSK